MSVAFKEHDYIGLSEAPSMESSDERPSTESGLELRLGLPGSGSSDKDVVKCSVAGAKRGFSDAIEFTRKWGLAAGPGEDSDGPNCNGKPGSGSPAGKDGVAPPSPNPGLEKKPQDPAPAAKTQVVGWPPVRSCRAQAVGWPPVRSSRKNFMSSRAPNNTEDAEGSGCIYVKVSMEGAPYLRKVDLRTYKSYVELSSALEKMFSCFTIGTPENGLADLLHGSSEYVLTYEDKDGDWMLVGDVPWEMFTESCKRLKIMKSSEAIGLAPRATEKSKNRN